MVCAARVAYNLRMRPRVILHADMDAFYASVEQRDRPELRGRPVIVGGTSTRGVVCAASYEARVYGVHSAMPTVRARALCPDAVFLRGDMAKYRRVSRQIRTVFESVSPEVEPLSLDEAFLDVTASRRLFGTPLEIGRLLKERVRAATGLAVSVGIGPGKMVAKLASDASKPDGLLEVPEDGVRAFLDPLPVGRLWGVGPVTRGLLDAAGIRTVADLIAAAPEHLERIVGPAAEHLCALARGDDSRVVEADREAKSIGEEGTFAEDVRHDAPARAAIIVHAEAVARRLRHAGLRGRVVVLKMKLAQPLGGGKYRQQTRRTTLDAPTDDGKALSDAALTLWERHRPRIPVRLLGVAAMGLVPGDAPQLGLFDGALDNPRRALNSALDRLVERFGDGVVKRGGHALEKDPTTQMKRGT
jgi:DNA polymerase-4